MGGVLGGERYSSHEFTMETSVIKFQLLESWLEEGLRAERERRIEEG
jgi:hypothetical protein